FVQRLFRVQLVPEAMAALEQRPRPRRTVESHDEVAVFAGSGAPARGAEPEEQMVSPSAAARPRPAPIKAGPRVGRSDPLPCGAVDAIEQAPGHGSQRVLSPTERESLSPEAWGYLLDLKRRGSLDSGQFERVLDRLSASGMRPVDVETAHEMAVRIAMPGFAESSGGESDVAH